MPAKPPKPGKPPKPPPNPDPSAPWAAAAPAAPAPAAAATAAWLAAATAGVKPRFIELPIRGPSVEPTTEFTSPMNNHSGAAAYSVIRFDAMLPSENPDDVEKIPPGPTVGDEDEDEPPPNAEDKGDARFCRAV